MSVITPSWYPTPNFDPEFDKMYLEMLEGIFKVKNPMKEWVPYKLTPHQVEFHLHDLAYTQYRAVDRLVVKSRNTSFTTSSLIALIMAAANWGDHDIPLIRMTFGRAKDLIREASDIIRNVNVEFQTRHYGYVFLDPAKIIFDATKIIFPNGSRMIAYPATNSAAETLRGSRILTGLVDESNFMKDFKDILEAFEKASSGRDTLGRKLFQMNIGTTLKGRTTPFFEWYDKIKENPTNFGYTLLYWHAVDPDKIQANKSLIEQDLVTIVPWLSLEDLELARRRDINTFNEEYMCMPVDSDEAFLGMPLILSCVDDSLTNFQEYTTRNPLYMGVDIASKYDYFALSIFEKTEFGFVQRHLYYVTKVELPELQRLCEIYMNSWDILKCRIDMTGMGYQLAQYMRKKYGVRVDPINFASRSKGLEKKQNIPIKEKMMTNLKFLMQDAKIKLIDDDMQIRHMNSINYQYKSEHSNEYGHSDIAWSNALALLPFDYRARGSTPLATNLGYAITTDENKPLIIPDVQW